MNRNVAIVIVILVVVVIAGYLVWIRSRYQQPLVPNTEKASQVSPSPVESASPTSSPSASPKQASGSAKQKTSTPSSNNR